MGQEPTGDALHLKPGQGPARPGAWWLRARPARPPGPPLRGAFEVDVAVVGAGFSGLWAACELLERRPDRRVAIVEAKVAGSGGSASMTGCSSPLAELGSGSFLEPARLDRFAQQVAAVQERLERWGIDAAFRQGPAVAVAGSRDELQHLGDQLRRARRAGVGDEGLCWVEPEPGRRRPALDGALGLLQLDHGVALDPGLLVDALVEHLRQQGALLFEHSPVLAVGRNIVEAAGGWLSARAVLTTMGIDTRAVLPSLSSELTVADWHHVVTAPLDELSWARLGWPERLTVYGHDAGGWIRAQRAPSNRLVWSWSPTPPPLRRLWHRLNPTGEPRRQLIATLRSRLPASVPAEVAYTWSNRSVSRVAGPTLGHDPVTGVFWALTTDDDALQAAAQADEIASLVDR